MTERKPHPFMPTRAEGKDPNVCHNPGCGQPWNAITHQPSLYLAALKPYRAVVSEAVQKLSEEAGVPEDLVQHERASGPPFRPSEGSAIRHHQVTCPECDNAYVKGNIRRHLHEVHQWTGDQWDDWAESVNFLELPTVPDVLTQAIEADRERLAQVEAFLNPDITMEQTMNDAANANAIDPEKLVAGPGVKLDPNTLEAALTAWWMDKASEETSAVVPKAVEYSSTDLRDIGRDLAECMGRQVSDEEATEMGIYFYLRGKLSRWTGALKEGRRPSDDTLFDLGIYVRMAQRVRDTGGWPGLPEE